MDGEPVDLLPVQFLFGFTLQLSSISLPFDNEWCSAIQLYGVMVNAQSMMGR